jgi:hypothetical protein
MCACAHIQRNRIDINKQNQKMYIHICISFYVYIYVYEMRLFLFLFVVWFFIFPERQGLIMYSRLVLNSQSSCLRLMSTGFIDMCHHG